MLRGACEPPASHPPDSTFGGRSPPSRTTTAVRSPFAFPRAEGLVPDSCPFPRAGRAPRSLRGVAVACLAAAAAAAWAPAQARIYDPFQVPKARYVAPLAPWPAASYRSKDFAIHKKGTYYHLFYTRVHRHVPSHWNS